MPKEVPCQCVGVECSGLMHLLGASGLRSRDAGPWLMCRVFALGYLLCLLGSGVTTGVWRRLRSILAMRARVIGP